MNYLSQTFWSIAVLIMLFALDDVHLDSFGMKTEEAIVSLQSYPSVHKQSDSDCKTKRNEDYIRQIVYQLDEVDVLPLYGMPCGATLRVCNQKNIAAFISRHIELPDGPYQKDVNGLEFVKVIVKSDGSLRDIQYVETKNDSCEWCEQAAVQVVSKMSDWKPALKNGLTVPVQVIIPIRFLGKA